MTTNIYICTKQYSNDLLLTSMFTTLDISQVDTLLLNDVALLNSI